MVSDPDVAAELYIHDESLCKRCPDVLADFVMPKYFGRLAHHSTSPRAFRHDRPPPIPLVSLPANDILQRVPRTSQTIYRDAWPSFFAGPEGSASGLHVDSFGSHFFMYLMEGRKHWRLFRSTDREFLHPRGAAFDVDVMCPDIDKVGVNINRHCHQHPRFSSDQAIHASLILYCEASSTQPHKLSPPTPSKFGSDLAQTQPYDAIMQPGDLMFIPSGAPHQVLNLDDTLAVR